MWWLFRDCTLLTCTTKGNASIRSIELVDSSTVSSCIDSPKIWNVCSGGNILCCKVDGNEKFALFGGWVHFAQVWILDCLNKLFIQLWYWNILWIQKWWKYKTSHHSLGMVKHGNWKRKWFSNNGLFCFEGQTELFPRNND